MFDPFLFLFFPRTINCNRLAGFFGRSANKWLVCRRRIRRAGGGTPKRHCDFITYMYVATMCQVKTPQIQKRQKFKIKIWLI